MSDYKELIKEVNRICKEVGRFIQLEQTRLSLQNIEEKGRNNFVTYVDKAAETLIIGELHSLIPDAVFLAEENTKTEQKEEFSHRWIIDPIDGTTNFIHGVPCYSISIALEQQGEIVAGTVYDVVNKECFWSVKGDKAYINETPIKVSNRAKLEDALLVTGFPYRHGEALDQWMELFKHFIKNTHGVRRLGSAALDLAWVAAGRFESFYEYGLSPWDVAAGAFIVKQAGGEVTDFSGGDSYLFGHQLISSNKILHAELMSVINEYLKGINFNMH
jgi:myo-inositol-1(or 4)-monophosphatase